MEMVGGPAGQLQHGVSWSSSLPLLPCTKKVVRPHDTSLVLGDGEPTRGRPLSAFTRRAPPSDLTDEGNKAPPSNHPHPPHSPH